ncbi:MAG: TIGR04219 family outer membrane beta-barrel protein [Nitrospiraceae bacterium]|nr:TIGR04219 family outer membrane beta-barrel protein [Nitrospiraceae bacterium]
MRIKILAMTFLVSFFLMYGAASAIGLEAAIGVWNQDPSGDISYKGESLSVGNDLKYDSEVKFFGRAKIELPLIFPNIYLMATPMKFEGSGQKNVNFQFGDKTFTGSVPFNSKIQLDHYDICFYYNLPFLKTLSLGKLNAEVGLNARIFDFKAEIDQPSTGIKETKNMTLPVPMVYVGAQFKPIKLFSLEAEARGIAFSGNHYYDLVARLKVKPIGPLFIAGGYRYEDVKIDEKSVKASLKFQGPFVETGLEF